MPWWSWLVIWAGLVVVLLVVLGLLAWNLFRKLVAVFDELETLAAKVEILEAAADLVEKQHSQLALLARYTEVQRAYNLRMRRRTARKAERQSGRVARGKVITSLDAAQLDSIRRTWPDVR